MTVYENLTRKSELCMLAAARCWKSAHIAMSDIWYEKACQLHEKANSLTIEEAGQNAV
jgi:hypothetical protein